MGMSEPPQGSRRTPGNQGGDDGTDYHWLYGGDAGQGAGGPSSPPYSQW